MKNLNLNIGIMTPTFRDALSKPFRVESINTDRQWCFGSEKEIESFMFGRNEKFYRIFKQIK